MINIYSAYDIIFPSYFLASFSRPRNQYAGFFFFLKSPLTLSKVKKSNNHLLSRQILMSIISKAFWNNRGQNPRGKGGIHFYLPSPGKNIRTYGDDMINFFASIWSPLSSAKRERSEASINLSRKIINVLLDGLVCSIVGYFYSSRKKVSRCYTLIRPVRYLCNNCCRSSTFFHRGTIKSFTSQWRGQHNSSLDLRHWRHLSRFRIYICTYTPDNSSER